MTSLATVAKRSLVALTLSLAAATAQADLTASEAAQVEKLRGTGVFSSDGALVGLIEGASISGDRAALFLTPGSGDVLRQRGKDIIIRTNTSELSLRGTQIILNADAQRVRTKAFVQKEDDDQVTVTLPRI
ncbi:hypothetical protein [Tateyamaria omphalii]|uniref:PRC-barrel domain-containing protein n=1 Tax=Tateyamaria omphalii TaxID=299262 RepID=A0A1P8MUM9_9RHOB|nr:hypothetical protein [Tateyamaria omphalii]APX11702.1 hypothetical protein BWR18_08415 [Tateyamaria omphalii]